MKSLFKALIPPVFQSLLKDIFLKKNGYLSGPYATWALAKRKAIGYQDPIILEKIKKATLQTTQALAQDMKVNTESHCSYSVFSALLKLSIENNGRLRVLDFGGGLGSTYFAFRKFCPKSIDLDWEVIEQAAFVAAGKTLSLDPALSFDEDCMSGPNPDVVLFSASLQYIEKPYEIISQLIEKGIRHFIFDRIWFVHGNTDKIIVENVPEHIYKSSYPCWLLSYSRFKKYLSEHFDGIHEFSSLEGKFEKNGFSINSKGFFVSRSQT